MAIPVYNTGTVSVPANGTVVSGGGTTIWGNNVREGDWIVIDGAAITMVLAVTDDDNLVIPEWKFGAKTNVEYAIYQNYSARSDTDGIARDVGTIVAAINANGFPWIVAADRNEPDPSLGDEGQTAFQPGTGKQWHKEGGAWVYDGIFKPLGTAAPYDNGKTYFINDVVGHEGSSYVWISSTPSAGHAPPNATYWQVLAEKGDTGPAVFKPIVAWAPATSYVSEAPASFVSANGSSYACATPHTSTSSFTNDLANGLWKLVASKGADAPTYGGTSTTSLTVGTGTKAFTTQQNGLAYQNGARVRATSASDVYTWMEGPVSYTFGSSALTMSVDDFNGSGTVSDWKFNIAGQPGEPGGVTTLNGQGGGLLLSLETKARVSLTSGVAITESDIASATSLYVIPAGHNMAPIFDGSYDVPRIYGQIPVVLDTTRVLASHNYDIWQAYSGGAVVAGFGPAWDATNGSDSSRGTGGGSTEFEMFNGRAVNKNAITIWNNSVSYSIPARQANLVGGFRATANGMTEDSAAKRFVWSVCGEPRSLIRSYNKANWPYNTATLRQTDANVANQVEWLHGLSGRELSVRAISIVSNNTTTGFACFNGIGIDSTSVNSAVIREFKGVTDVITSLNAAYEGYPGLGYHRAVWLEAGNAGGTQTWYGQVSSGGQVVLQPGMVGTTIQ